MGHGHGGAQQEAGGPPDITVRDLASLSLEWFNGLSAAEQSALRDVFNDPEMMAWFNDKTKGKAPEIKQQLAFERAMRNAPGIQQGTFGYIPVNEKTMPLVRQLASGGSANLSLAEMHFWQSTAFDSSSKFNRVIRVRIPAGTQVGGLSAMGGKDLRAPKMYVKNARLSRTSSTKDEQGRTIYNAILSITN